MQMSKTVAIVSGKGGSGKTLIATSIAQVLDDLGQIVTLVDTDFGTGGLSYYLGINKFSGIGFGLSDLILKSHNESTSETVEEGEVGRYFRELRDFKQAKIVSIGNHRKLTKVAGEGAFSEGVVGNALSILRNVRDGMFILDCRGGIDAESIAVCQFADSIIIVAETDPASFQATAHLADVLSDADLDRKIGGFIVNRVFDNPRALVRNGSTAFRAPFLGAIPFDLDATRRFHNGELPGVHSLFGSHVWQALHQWLPDEVNTPRGRVFDMEDFGRVTIADAGSSAGGATFAALIAGLGAVTFVYLFQQLLAVESTASEISFLLGRQRDFLSEVEQSIFEFRELSTSLAESNPIIELRKYVEGISDIQEDASRVTFSTNNYISDLAIYLVIFVPLLVILGVFASIGRVRQALGRLMLTYVGWATKALFR